MTKHFQHAGQTSIQDIYMSGICPHCGKVSNEDSPRFCSGCGARMDGTLMPGFPGYAGLPVPQKSTTIAGFCSSFLPGLGQVYNGETAKGFVLFFLTLIGLFVFLIPGLLVWLYAMYDAYAVAGKMNTGEIPFRETSTMHMAIFIVVAVMAIIVAILIIVAMVMASLASELGPLGLSGTGNYNHLFQMNGLF
jgi:TM2 domain-containing membrane protein YozV